MRYVPIERSDQIRKAFKALRSALQSTGTPAKHGVYGGCDYADQKIWSAWGERDKQQPYWIGFGKAGNSNSMFQANPSKEGVKGVGLFVNDEDGRTHLVHKGYFHLPSKRRKEVRKT